ncbi:MAG TPA: hypothetical protein VGM64_17550 [Lacunisphaera sp.]|jgi:hypothetical protein
MNLRVYLRLFRPANSLAFTAIYTAVAAAERSVFHLNSQTAWFLAFAVATPLLLGFSLAGAVHEPMHRSFVLLLPGATRILRRATVGALSVFAVFATLAAALANPSIPPLATFGLACALLALPCLDRRKHLYGMSGMLFALVAWIGMNAFIGGRLPGAMAAAPWRFCVGGIAIAVAAIAVGFSGKHLRERIRFYFCAMPGSFTLIFDRQTTARQRQEQLLSRERRGSRTMKHGRDWPVRSVGSSTSEWMRVILHAFWGRNRNGSFSRVVLSFTAMFASYAFGLPFLFHLLGHLTTESNALPSYWETLTQFTGPVSMLGHSHNLPMALMSMMAPLLQPGFAGIFAVLTIRPQLPYPISRQRLARTAFGLALLQLNAALLIPGLVVFLASLLGQLLSGQMAANYGLHSVVGIDLMLAISLPLLACSGTFKNSAISLLWAILVGATITAAALLRDQWIPVALTVPGLLIAIPSIAGAIGLLWLSLQREYRVRDLLFEPGPLGTAPV